MFLILRGQTLTVLLRPLKTRRTMSTGFLLTSSLHLSDLGGLSSGVFGCGRHLFILIHKDSNHASLFVVRVELELIRVRVDIKSLGRRIEIRLFGDVLKALHLVEMQHVGTKTLDSLGELVLSTDRVGHDGIAQLHTSRVEVKRGSLHLLHGSHVHIRRTRDHTVHRHNHGGRATERVRSTGGSKSLHKRLTIVFLTILAVFSNVWCEVFVHVRLLQSGGSSRTDEMGVEDEMSYAVSGKIGRERGGGGETQKSNEKYGNIKKR